MMPAPFARNPIFGPLAQKAMQKAAAPKPVLAPKPAAPPARAPFARNPIFGPLAQKVIQKQQPPAAPKPIVQTSAPLAMPVRGTAITSPIYRSSPTSMPSGSILRMQPAGAPPSGAPPSMAFVTSAAGLAPQDSGFDFSAPVAVGQFSVPMGWLLLGGIVVVLVLARS